MLEMFHLIHEILIIKQIYIFCHILCCFAVNFILLILDILQNIGPKSLVVAEMTKSD